MRHFLIPVLLLSLIAGCSSVKLGPHRIDVQQGNALDQENVARLKPGLNRSQVRFLLGTPLVVDPFRTDRWDYVYVYYKAGRLAEQKHITLFFEGDTLARIEGDLPEPATQPAVPAAEPASQPAPATPVAPPAGPESRAAEPMALAAEPRPEPQTEPVSPPAAATAASAEPAPATAEPVPATPAASVPNPQVSPETVSAPSRNTVETSVVAPLPSPKNAPAYVDPRVPAELSLQPETNVEQIRPDVIPPFPEPDPATGGSADPVLKSVSEWADAWARRDEEAYLAAYDASFTPEGGGSRADWEKRRRLLLGVARNIDLKIESPSVDRNDDGTATVTFQQIYRSDSYRDAVVKKLRMVERDDRWLIVDEQVQSILGSAQP